MKALEKRGHLPDPTEEGGEGGLGTKPCGLNVAMVVGESEYGAFEVEYRKSFEGLPGDPVFRCVRNSFFFFSTFVSLM